MIRDNWIRAYDVINSTNIVLANLDLAESGETRDNIEGQARAIRGIVYFEVDSPLGSAMGRRIRIFRSRSSLGIGAYSDRE